MLAWQRGLRLAETQRILEEALHLPEDQRAELAVRLLHSVDAPDPHGHLKDEELAAEIARRTEDAMSGRTKGIPWEKVRARLAEYP